MADDLRAKLREGSALLLEQMKYLDRVSDASARSDTLALAAGVSALSAAVGALRTPDDSHPGGA